MPWSTHKENKQTTQRKQTNKNPQSTHTHTQMLVPRYKKKQTCHPSMVNTQRKQTNKIQGQQTHTHTHVSCKIHKETNL